MAVQSWDDPLFGYMESLRPDMIANNWQVVRTSEPAESRRHGFVVEETARVCTQREILREADQAARAGGGVRVLGNMRVLAAAETQPTGARESQVSERTTCQAACGTAIFINNARARLSAKGVLDALDCADMVQLEIGDGLALDRLMSRHRQWLHAWLRRVLGNSSDALDVIQEAFLRVYIHRHRFDPQRVFQAWLSTIAINLARSRLRWRRRQPPGVSLSEDLAGDDGSPMNESCDFIDERPDPADSLQRSEWLDALGKAMALLPANFRIPLERFALDDVSQAQIAHELGCSVKTVEMRIYRARQRIREEMDEFGGKPEGSLLSKRIHPPEPFRARPSERSAAGPD